MKKKLSSLLAVLLTAVSIAGCSGSDVTIGSEENKMSSVDASREMESLLKRVTVHEVEDPKLDIYTDEISENAALADISTFPIVTESKGDINIEVAAATELSSESPDDWIVTVAKNFSRSGATVNGKTVGISIRQITSGEAVTYVNAEVYQPNVFIPSNSAWGEMIKSSGIGITKIEDRIAGNTAGMLLSEDAYNTVTGKYKEVTVENVLTAATAGDITFAYTNPYTSSTGLNMLTAMLKAFDPSDPLSDKASAALLEYQKTSPPVAYTTAVLRNQASKGIIDAMIMEEQAYINTPALKGFKYVPFGIRHDHPVYTFDWNTEEQNEAAKLFVEFCLNQESQSLATDRGFNGHENYAGEDPGLTGTGYLTAQSLWKQNKSGGKPVVAVFIADISGSMKGDPLAALQESIIATLPYIGSEHYIGLVSYSDDVTINLPIEQFNDKHRALFSGEMKNLIGNGGTHTYDAVLVGLDMIEKKLTEIPEAEPIIFLLTDGEAMGGYSLSRVSPIVAGMQVPVYCIAYNYNNMQDLEQLSSINEAATVRADSTDIVNQLRNLFNTQL